MLIPEVFNLSSLPEILPWSVIVDCPRNFFLYILQYPSFSINSKKKRIWQIYDSGRSQVPDPDPDPDKYQTQDLNPLNYHRQDPDGIQDGPDLQPCIERMPEGSHEWQDAKADRIERCRQAGKGRKEKQAWIERCRQAGKGRKER